jgi:nucleoside-diphosphate-sugar epimerase
VGNAVRATVGAKERDADVRGALAEVVDTGDRLDLAVADLLDDDGWEAALDGCRYVIHPASPLGGGDEVALIATARDGALRVLRAAAAAGVERVVLTSAANAASHADYREPGETDETLWTDPDAPGLDAYRRSKTLAERAAWELAAEHQSTALTTVLPGAVFGPILGTDNIGSVDVIGRLLRGEVPQVPRLGLEVVDVRDVADAHVRAMTAPAAAGERFLATGELLWLTDIARLLKDELGDAAAKVSTAELPDSEELAAVLPGIGRRNTHSTAKARRLLGWSPRPGRDAVLDCARSLLAHGVA